MFGFSTIQTTLLGCVDGVIESMPCICISYSDLVDISCLLLPVVTIFTAVKATSLLRDSRGYVGALWAVPAIVGGILVITLPFSHKVGLLFSYWTARKFALIYGSEVDLNDRLFTTINSMGNSMLTGDVGLDGHRHCRSY